MDEILNSKYWTKAHVMWCQHRDSYPMFLIQGQWWLIDVPEDMSDQTAFFIDAEANCKEWAYDEIECAEVFQTRFNVEDVSLKMVDELIDGAVDWKHEVENAR